MIILALQPANLRANRIHVQTISKDRLIMSYVNKGGT